DPAQVELTPSAETVSRPAEERSCFAPLPDGIGAGIPARSGDLEACEVVRPSLRVRCNFVFVRESRVNEMKQREIAVLLKIDLDRGRSWTDEIVILPSEGVDEPSRWIYLDERAARDMPAGDIHRILAADTEIHVCRRHLPSL